MSCFVYPTSAVTAAAAAPLPPALERHSSGNMSALPRGASRRLRPFAPPAAAASAVRDSRLARPRRCARLRTLRLVAASGQDATQGDASTGNASDAAAVAAVSNEETDTRVPVTCITGFLGSGKSTLLNRILTERHGKRFAVIENEFGEVGIDDELVRRHVSDADADDIFEMNNGCLCCTVRGDLVRILTSLLDRTGNGDDGEHARRAARPPLDGILIETTGMADPAPVIQTFFLEEELAERLRLDGVLTVVDAKHILTHLGEGGREGGSRADVSRESTEQIAFADRILLNKTDLVHDEAEMARVRRAIRRINTAAPVIPCVHAQVDMSSVLDIGAFDLERVTERDPMLRALADDDERGDSADHDAHHRHHHLLQHDDDERVRHDTSIISIGVVERGELNLGRLNEWLGDLLETRGADIYRMKGVLAIRGAKRRYVFQGVHMTFESMPSEPWREHEQRVSRLVFIGRDLDRDKITAAFRSCLERDAATE